MAAIEKNLIVARDVVMRELMKREKSWPHRNPGVMVVFCIVFVVAVALIGLFISKQLAKRKANKSQI